MRLPGGIRVRIALVLVAIVAGALGTAYLIVVPSLERRLVDARLSELEELAVPLAESLPGSRFEWPETVERFDVATNTRVVAFDVVSRTPPALLALADSRPSGRGRMRTLADDEVARRAVTTGEVERGRVVSDMQDYADVAVPKGQDVILLFRAPLADSLATVQLVKRRLLLATGFALVLALVLGLTAAGMLASRLRRLETAAERIAGGDFDVPIVDHGDDEIGQLAHAFDRMRVQLAQLDDARKEFVANASHELRTPIFSLGGFLELLADEELDEETRGRFLATMQEQVERLAKLSTDLLDLSRVDAGQLSVAVEDVDLAEVVRGLAAELEHIASGSGHVFDAHGDGHVWALADEERVAQIGRALVVNALVHTPSGTRVSLAATRRGDRAELAVVDDGPGIPASQREAVFERFYRVEGGKASGSGLGLAIARELARLMGGTVRLESEPGRTVLTLDLPAGPGRSPAHAGSFSRENAPGRGGEAP
ncbi:MAG TPA: ATP-binding protein [Gaiellaceae bacterium]|nr:ATP-binding protein [Gaiellaceae bacterium]